MKIGIMGGTFDPIHYGHLLAAEEARINLGIERLIFVPTGDPPYKRGNNITSAEDRYAMTLLATAGVIEYSVSRIEIDRKEPTHTVDTLREFLASGIKTEDLYFITGLDAMLSITSWFEYEKIPDLCTLVTARRPGYPVDEIETLPKFIRDKLKYIEIPQFAISSTEIRERSRLGKGIRFLVPHLVEIYIESNKLYKI
ncbi:MAG: nicotinate-nucleotide adenylyltransferase [Synergistaceae bacterium]|nr:nicotinate-nucleotide adenylyltransferase [Synergistaceae bacterium]MBQ6435788.1 nicotinate-nucleotide adenylyltransferase [Synergistaceae bacterium]MBQ6739087.1 nicotinate-nucleotide adenylyltransferase [Synergistaceae bacterium]MBQ7069560.1 nicotinate-nucleotide adenylyltransferase [Synergistaceae bacterium]MBR0075569.1 nicotinate-nucleotide adenylyltransferase [Synergistaceae bacterium]